MNKLLPLVTNILEKSPIFIAFVLPLLFVPITSEFFETAKIAFVILVSSSLFIVWTLKMVLEKKVTLVRSALDLPLFVWLLALLLATIFAPDLRLALTGAYLRFQPTVVTILASVLCFYVLAANLKRAEIRQLSVFAFVVAVALGSALSLIAYFGLTQYIPVGPLSPLAFIKSPFFNTFGSTGTAGLMAALAVVLNLSLLLARNQAHKSHETHESYETYYRAALEVSLYPLVGLSLAYRSPLGLMTLFLGLALFTFYQSAALVKAWKTLAPLLAFAAVLAVILLTPTLRQTLKLPVTTDVSLGLNDSWQVASQVLTNRPIFGTGPGRFVEAFSFFRPITLNNNQFWGLRFDKPFSEVLLYLTETGLVGVLLLAFTLFKIVSFALKSKADDPLSTGVAVAVMLLAVSFLFAPTASVTNFFLLFFLSLLVAGEEESSGKLAERIFLNLSAIREKLVKSINPTAKSGPLVSYESAILPYLFLTLAVIYTILIVPAAASMYAGEVFSRQADLAVAKNDGRAALSNRVQSIALNPNLDVYQRSLAQISLGVAANLSSRGNLTDADRTTITNLVQEAINRSRLTTEVINPGSVANWESRAQVYQSLIGVAQSADAWATDAYTRAISLEPTNPGLRLSLGGIYFAAKDYTQAANLFSQASSLKPDFANAHYNLAKAFTELKRKDDALAQYDIVLGLLTDKNSADYKTAKKEREALSKADLTGTVPAAAAASASGQELNVATPKPSVEKNDVVPPINLGKPKEASPAAAKP